MHNNLPEYMSHAYGVAKKMYRLAAEKGLNEKECEDMWLIGLLYSLEKYAASVGLLKRNGLPTDDGLIELKKAEMSIDSMGHDVGFERKLRDIANRHGSSSAAYQEAEEMIKILEGEYHG